MRIIARYEKADAVRYVSHLDLQRLLHRALRRAKLPIAYSNGFNPHPLISFAAALAVGQTSEAEWLEISLDSPMAPEEFARLLNGALPAGVRVLEAFEAPESRQTLSAMMAYASYRVTLRFSQAVDCDAFEGAVKALLSGPIAVTKRSKSGDKEVDLRPMILSMEVLRCEGDSAELSVVGQLNASGSLNVELLMSALTESFGTNAQTRIHRDAIYAQSGGTLPVCPILNAIGEE
ncbi:MAG: TIGR03936 family radical SAM-associated protein [Bacillota bacterium]